MGVKGLWTVLSPSSKLIKLPSLAGKRLAIDASIWIVQLLSTRRRHQQGRVKGYISGLYFRLGKLLSVGVKPVVVFDGDTPRLKSETCKKRANLRSKRDEAYKDLLLQLLAAKMVQTPLKTVSDDGSEKDEEISLSSSESEGRESEEEEEKVRFEEASLKSDRFSTFQLTKYCKNFEQNSGKSTDCDLRKRQKLDGWAGARTQREISPERLAALKRLGIIPNSGEIGRFEEKIEPENSHFGRNQRELMASEPHYSRSVSSGASSSDSSSEDSEQTEMKEEMVVETPLQTEKPVFEADFPIETRPGRVSPPPPSPPAALKSDIPPPSPTVQQSASPGFPAETQSFALPIQPPTPAPPGTQPNFDLKAHISQLESQLTLHPLPDDLSKSELKSEITQLLSLLGIPWYPSI